MIAFQDMIASHQITQWIDGTWRSKTIQCSNDPWWNSKYSALFNYIDPLLLSTLSSVLTLVSEYLFPTVKSKTVKWSSRLISNYCLWLCYCNFWNSKSYCVGLADHMPIQNLHYLSHPESQKLTKIKKKYTYNRENKKMRNWWIEHG